MPIFFLFSFTNFYFIHMSDPQIGSVPEATTNLAQAVDQINQMAPLAHFVIVAGDLGNASADSDTVILYSQWMVCDSLLDNLTMPVYVVPGNHDIREPVRSYRQAFYRNFWGMDYYSFNQDSCHFLALNSCLLDTYSPIALPQDSFIRADLDSIQSQKYYHKFYLFHYPLYLSSPTEPDSGVNVNQPRRDTILNDLVAYDFSGVWTGHLHEELTNLYGPAMLVTGTATSMMVNPEDCGYRVVKVFENGIETFPVAVLYPEDTLPLNKIVMVLASPETVQVSQPVNFTAQVDTLNYPAWHGLSYRWLFGDGDSSNIASPTHTYSDTGHFSVLFTAVRTPHLAALYRLNILVLDGSHISEEAIASDNQFHVRIFSIQYNNIELEIFMDKTSTESAHRAVKVTLYDVSGRVAIGPVNKGLTPGLNRIRLAKAMPVGVYFYRIEIDESNTTGKCVLIR